MPCWFMHFHIQPITVVGIVLIVAGLAVYIVGIARALLRVRRQYSRAMPGEGRIRLGSALAASSRLWPFLLIAAAGVAVLVLTR